MSDQLDRLFEELHGHRPPAPFAPAEEVRRRGRRRGHRQAVSVGVAVVAVLAATGLGASSLATTIGQPEPVPPAASPTSPPAPPTSPTTVAEIPRDWLLAAGDLPPDTGWMQTTNELIESDWFWGTFCADYQPASVPDRLDLRTVSWVTESPPVPGRIDQLVELFTGDGATTHLEDVRAVVALCSRRPAPGDEVAPTHLEIVDSGLAGDESMLIVEQQYSFDGDEIVPEPHARFVALVRVGDVATTLVSEDEDLLRDLTVAAADRLP